MSSKGTDAVPHDDVNYLDRKELIPFFPYQALEIDQDTSALRELASYPGSSQMAASLSGLRSLTFKGLSLSCCGFLTTSSFISSLMGLPKEIRDKIYGYIPCEGGPEISRNLEKPIWEHQALQDRGYGWYGLSLPSNEKALYAKIHKISPPGERNWDWSNECLWDDR
jgi:hypothetical protein